MVAPARPMEIELKLRIDRRFIPRLRAHPLIASCTQGKPRVQNLASVYFDTPERILLRHGTVLRVRRANGQWLQTFKIGRGASGVVQHRGEWESRVKGQGPDVPALRDLLAGEPAASLFSRSRVAARLSPLFETRFRRTAWQLNLPGGNDVVELALDLGSVHDTKHSLPISEVELELKRGDPAALFEVALALRRSIPLSVELRSKSERGYALGEPAAASVGSRRIALDPEAPPADAAAAIVAACVAHVHGNAAGIVDAGDAEAIHQMRVGLRRLRFAVRLLDASLPCPGSVQEGLRWLAEELGEARDWHILAAETLPAVVEAYPETVDLRGLSIEARSRAADTTAAARRAVGSERYAILILSLGRWLGTFAGGGENAAALAESARSFAYEVLRPCRKRVTKRAAARGRTETDMHRFRIAIKKYRYALEFFASIYPARRIRPLLSLLRALQDDLGSNNDRQVAVGLLREIAVGVPALSGAARFVEGHLEAQSERRTQHLDRRWRRYLKLPSPWSRG